MSQPSGAPNPLQRAVAALEKMKARLDAVERAANEPIAIVGIGCRFPGGGEGPAAFWNVLDQGIDAIVEIPPERWPREAIPGERSEARWAGLLEGVDLFDSSFFGISRREAEPLDPQQRLLLEVSWEALEDAGLRVDTLAGQPVGVFIGLSVADYRDRVLTRGLGDLDVYCATGNALSIAAGRISYTFGFQGPALSIDTACSSSLVAIAEACQSLRAGDCHLAIAGGVNLLLSANMMAMLIGLQALSPDGRCRTLDARANGFVRGEGCGIVVLKRLSDAIRDGDRIHALIRGWAVNQDGRSTGLTAPNVLSQQALLRAALRRAQLEPADISYVEMHGTGTPLGDPIEAEALREVLGTPRPDGSSCVLGAAKTNIGHLECAAGVAGLIKIVLAMRHERIPRNLHFRRLNPRISLDAAPFVIPAEGVPWPCGEKRRRAGVSSFGLSGTNAHLIVEEARVEESKPAQGATCYLLPITAKTSEGLKALAKSYAEWLAGPNEISLPDAVYTASVRRMQHEHRLCATFSTREEAANQLAAFARAESPTGVVSGRSASTRPKVVFVFPGQGSQWLGMGRDLLEHSTIFREALEACDREIRLAGGFSVLEELSADESRSRLSEIDVVQPLLFSIEIALAMLWRSYGVEPDCVVGHSMGEVAAAHIAGILTLADAAKVICRRSRLLRGISGKGAMALVELPMEEAEKAIAGHAALLSVAVSNGPRSTVLSGDSGALEQVLSGLEKQGVFCRRVKVDVASHSPQVEPLRAELIDALEEIRPREAKLKMRSTVTGSELRGDEATTLYWWDNLRQPVQFSRVVQGLMRDGATSFIEMSPHPILLPSIEENLREAKAEGVALASMRRSTDGVRSVFEALGALFVRGYPIAWKTQFPAGGRVVSLPAYAWQRERYWIETKTSPTQSHAWHEEGAHPLLGHGVVSSMQPELHVWEQWLSISTFPYLKDHRIQGEIVFPGTGFIELVLAAAVRIFGEGKARLELISFEKMLVFAEKSERQVQVSVLEEGGGRASFSITSKEVGATEWVKHSSGVLRVVATSTASPEAESNEGWLSRCGRAFESEAHYTQTNARGLEYGPAFRGVESVWIGDHEWIARVRLPDSVSSAGYVVHPALLDACFQSGLGASLSMLGEETMVPAQVTDLRVFASPGREVWVHGRVQKAAVGEASLTMMVCDENGRPLVQIGSLHVKTLDEGTSSEQLPYSDCIFEVSWQKQECKRASLPIASAASAWLVILDRGGVGARLAENLRASGEYVVEISPELESDRAAFWDKALSDAFRDRVCRGVIHCGALDSVALGEMSEAALADELRAGVMTAMFVAQALLRFGFQEAPRLYLVTRGAQAVGEHAACISASQATLWGFGRAIAVEQPDLRCMRIDLEANPGEQELVRLVEELLAQTEEDQVALRREGRYVARLLPSQWDKPAVERKALAQGMPLRLGTREPGILERLSFYPIERRAPGPGEVEIEVEAAGLNFLDVMKAMGIYPGMDRSAIALGGECAGRIVAVGEGVTNFSKGQEVIASAPSSFASHVTTRVEFVVPKPENLSFEQAATIPGVFTTIQWALHHVARLSAGERILIHSATGGTGLAAIQYAKSVGAEIFATAGSEEKREFLRSMGISHVMDSRSLAFADEILAATNGRGVDVVLNSLTGDALVRSLEVLAPYGRFLEIGKKDIYSDTKVGLLPFRKALSYTAIDLAGMAEERPGQLGALLSEVMSGFESGRFMPPPLSIFDAHDVVSAFHLMANARHIGKIVVRMKDPKTQIVRSQQATPASIRADATYLMTGGMGGLGLSLAKWLVENGARNLVLVGRSAPNAVVTASIQALRDKGATVRVMQGDIARRADVAAIFAEIDRQMPPLRGIIHAAAVLEDRTLPEMTEEQLLRPMAPKVLGGLLLHEATLERPLDFFVTYSSVAALFGSPGQSNYAAANAYLDALCEARVSQGLAATSIQWGPFADVGLAAASDIRGNRIASRGAASFSPEEGNELFQLVLRHPRASIGLLRLDAEKWRASFPLAERSPFFSVLAMSGSRTQSTGAATIRDMLLRASPTERTGMVIELVLDRVGRVLRLDSTRIEATATFHSLGVDSLMSLEIRNRLESDLGLRLSATLLLAYPTPAALAEQLLARMGLGGADEVMQDAMNRESSDRGGSIVALIKGSVEPPFFFLPPLTGTPVGYQLLTQCLDTKRSFYSFTAPGVDTDAPPCDRVEDLAAQFLQLLRRVQPRGPYLLGGYSFGVLVAYEMAQQLTQSGEKVDSLVLVDLPPLGHERDKHPPLLQIARLLGLEGDRVRFDDAALLSMVVQRIGTILDLPKELGQEERIHRVMRAHLLALNRYTPGPYRGNVEIVRALTTVERMGSDGLGANDGVLGWSALCPHVVRCYDIEADHFSLLRTHAVNGLAMALKRE